METTKPMKIWAQIEELTDDELMILETYIQAEKRWREIHG